MKSKKYKNKDIKKTVSEMVKRRESQQKREDKVFEYKVDKGIKSRVITFEKNISL